MDTKIIKEINKAGIMAKGIFGLLSAFQEMLTCETIFNELELCKKHQGFSEEDCQKIFMMRVNKELEQMIIDNGEKKCMKFK